MKKADKIAQEAELRERAFVIFTMQRQSQTWLRKCDHSRTFRVLNEGYYGSGRMWRCEDCKLLLVMGAHEKP